MASRLAVLFSLCITISPFSVQLGPFIIMDLQSNRASKVTSAYTQPFALLMASWNARYSQFTDTLSLKKSALWCWLVTCYSLVNHSRFSVSQEVRLPHINNMLYTAVEIAIKCNQMGRFWGGGQFFLHL